METTSPGRRKTAPARATETLTTRDAAVLMDTPSARRKAVPKRASETLTAHDTAVLLSPISTPTLVPEEFHILRRRRAVAPKPEMPVIAKPATALHKETKKQRFRRIAVPRVEAALHAIDLVKFCASPIRYEYTPDQARKIVDKFLTKITELEESFSSRSVIKPPGFELDEG